MGETSHHTGKVFIAGAGPGAADLITLRGLRALHSADVVLYDALVDISLLSEASEKAMKIFVGKRCRRHSMEQREINEVLVAQARAGKTVVRLKGGDPLVFGRGGEEAMACVEAGVDFELIPGVSSALGAASYAGIPLTHRGIASSAAFITARGSRHKGQGDNRLAELARAVDTLVIFMGGERLQALAHSLMDAGLPAERAIAVISRATLADQRTVSGTLGSISDRVARENLSMPMIIIVGEVTNLGATLNWFEREKAVPLQAEMNIL